MKKIRFLSIILVVALVTVVLTGCTGGNGGNGGETSNDEPVGTTGMEDSGGETATGDSETETTPADEEKVPHEDLEDGNITIVYWQGMQKYQNEVARNENVYDPILDPIESFEQKYGGTVTVKAVNWNDMLSTMTQMQNAGEAPDLAMVYDRTMHPVILNNFVMPLDEYVTDADYSFWPVSRDLFSWQGKTYAIPVKPYLYYIMYNRDMFEMEGLELPDESFRQGRWNFETFEEVGKKLTKRVDGELAQYAFTSWTEIISAFIISNGGAIVNVNSQTGEVTSGLNDPKTLSAISIISGWVDNTTGFINIHDNDFGGFDNNRVAMNRGKEFPVDLPFEVGMVPVPAGPDASGKTIYLYPQALAVPVGASNPEGAVAFVYHLNQHQKEVGDLKEANRIGQENYDMIYADDVNYVYAYDKGFDGYDNIEATIVNYMSDGVPAATIAESLDSQIKAAIAKTFGNGN